MFRKNKGKRIYEEGRTFLSRGNADAAVQKLRKAEAILRKTNSSKLLGMTLNNLGAALFLESKLDEALPVLKEAEEIFRSIENYEELFRAIKNQGNVYLKRGEYDIAMAKYQEKERICRKIGDPRQVGKALHDQAMVLFMQGKYNHAEALFKEAEKMCRDSGEWSGLGYAVMMLGGIAQKRDKDIERAMKSLIEAKKHFERAKDKIGLAQCQQNAEPILKLLRMGGVLEKGSS